MSSTFERFAPGWKCTGSWRPAKCQRTGWCRPCASSTRPWRRWRVTASNARCSGPRPSWLMPPASAPRSCGSRTRPATCRARTRPATCSGSPWPTGWRTRTPGPRRPRTPSPAAETPRWPPRWWPGLLADESTCLCRPGPTTKSWPASPSSAGGWCAASASRACPATRPTAPCWLPSRPGRCRSRARGPRPRPPSTAAGRWPGRWVDSLVERDGGRPARLDRLFVQVGGGALATAVVTGLAAAVGRGDLARMPRVHAVQPEGNHPLVRAWDTLVLEVRAQERAGGGRDRQYFLDRILFAQAARRAPSTIGCAPRLPRRWIR